MSRSVIYLNRRGRKFSRSRARQWWRTSDPMVVSAGADLVSIGVDVVSIGVVSIGDDVLSIGDDVIHPTGNIMRKHRQA
jgi:tRNA G37 N-methylase TrmD